jgi:1-acyl-sn-glycerol-3-phosphate acyltransferase
MLRLIARALLGLGGWTPVGGTLEVPKAVLIAAPHTSNWDGIWGLIYRVAFRLDIHFFAKEALFWFPLGLVLKSLGGVPLDRSKAGGAVPMAIAALRDNASYYVALAPEGTRRRQDYWKSGFYRIAREAGVPVVLGFLDYGRRRLGTGPVIELSGDVDADMARIRAFYEDIEGHHPENATPAALAPRDSARPMAR